MKAPNKNIILYSLVALIAIIAIILFFRKNQLSRELASHQETAIDNLNAENIFKRFITIDSLIMNDDFASARQAYEILLKEINNSELTNIIQQRISQLQAMQTRKAKQQDITGENLQQVLLEKSRQIDSLSRKLSVSKDIRVDEMDSLRFALAKANMRMESLTEQLASKTKSDYLKFSDNKGNEIYYVGQIKENKSNGWGVALYSNGSRYEGEWQNNMRDGEGVFYWPDGEYYKGNFVLDQRQGEGKYYWPNGEMFAGEWQNDKRNGEGVFYGKDGDVVAKGIWQNNELVRKE